MEAIANAEASLDARGSDVVERRRLRVAIVRLGATPLVVPGVPGEFGGAEVRAATFAHHLSLRPDIDVQIVVQTIADGTRPSLANPQPRDALHVTMVPPWRRKARASAAGRFAAVRFPWVTARRFWGSCLQRVDRRPPQRPEYEQLDADVIGTFGLQDPSASVIRAALATGRRACLFATSDDDVARAVLSQERGRDVRRQRWALQHAHAIVVQTEFQRKSIESLGKWAIRIRNPIDCSVPPSLEVPWAKREYALWVGRADRDSKRADLCWELARSCPQIPFVAIMNPGDPVVTRELLATCPPNVRYVERVAWQESDALYARARVLLNTSDGEGFPNAFLQAAKFSVPILSRRVDPDGVLRDHGIGYCADDCPQRLAELTRAIFRDPSAYHASAERARAYVVAHHDAAARAEELHAAFSKLLAMPL